MPTSILYILIPLGIILTALLVLSWTVRFKRRMGLPVGKIVYVDSEKWGRTQKPLYDSKLGLTGKPDYLIQKNDGTIPVEVKSSWAPFSPYDSHVMQLAAYCLLVERNTGNRPPYGLLRYKNRTYKIQYSKRLEMEIIDLIGTIRSQKNSKAVNRSHNQAKRCARCGFRNRCDQRI